MSLLTNLFRGAASVPMGALKLATRGRTGQATAAVAGGFLASSYLSHLSGVKKNYYGEKEYQSQYRGGIDTAASLAPYAGGALGLSMLLGGGSVPGRILNTAKRTAMLPGALVAGPINRRANIAARFNLRASRQSLYKSQNPGVVQQGRYTSHSQGLYQPTNFKGPSEGAANFSRAYMNLFNKGGGIMPSVLVSAASNAVGYAGLKATAAMMSAPGTTAAVVGGIVGATALQKAAWIGGVEGFVGMGAIGAAATAGVYAGSRLPVRSAGEGYISDFRVNAQSTSGKMDFNTAGLVQAMHYNRRG